MLQGDGNAIAPVIIRPAEVGGPDVRPIGIELPKVVELEVKETEPGLKGATASNSPKPAKLETGLTVAVPTFVNVGDRIRVDTTTGEYLERAK